MGKQIKCLGQKREGGLIYKLFWLGWKLDCVTALFSWMKCLQLSQMVFPINTIYWERNVGISFDHNTKCLVYCEEYWLRIQLPLCCTCTFQVKCLFLCTFTSSQDIFNKHHIMMVIYLKICLKFNGLIRLSMMQSKLVKSTCQHSNSVVKAWLCNLHWIWESCKTTQNICHVEMNMKPRKSKNNGRSSLPWS